MSPPGNDAREMLVWGAQRLRAAGIDSSRMEARVLLSHALGGDSRDVQARGGVAATEADHFAAMIARRVAHEPLAYIVGRKEFWSRDFEVGPGVLVPRPETETLIEQALCDFPNREAALHVLDLGTGTACLLVTCLAHYPNARGVGIDISSRALDWARRNVAKYGLESRCELREGNWSDLAGGAFDVVFANPPYLSQTQFSNAQPEIAVFEPRDAFVGGGDGFDAYRSLAPAIARNLKRDGRAFVEIGAGQAESVARISLAAGLDITRFAPDLAGILRCAVAGHAPGGRAATDRSQKTVGKEAVTR